MALVGTEYGFILKIDGKFQQYVSDVKYFSYHIDPSGLPESCDIFGLWDCVRYCLFVTLMVWHIGLRDRYWMECSNIHLVKHPLVYIYIWHTIGPCLATDGLTFYKSKHFSTNSNDTLQFVWHCYNQQNVLFDCFHNPCNQWYCPCHPKLGQFFNSIIQMGGFVLSSYYQDTFCFKEYLQLMCIL